VAERQHEVLEPGLALPLTLPHRQAAFVAEIHEGLPRGPRVPGPREPSAGSATVLEIIIVMEAEKADHDFYHGVSVECGFKTDWGGF
jgi:hypothetical protein